MGFLRRIVDAIDPAPKTEKRYSNLAASYRFANIHTGGGYPISPAEAESLAAVSAAISVISSAIASFPVNVYRNVGDGRVAAPDHPIAALFASGPNAHQSGPEFIEQMVSEALRWGNALAEAESDQNGRVTAMQPIPWGWIAPVMLQSGRLAFDVTPPQGAFFAIGKSPGPARQRRLFAEEVVHLRDRSDDGVLGRPRLSRSPDAVRLGLTMQRQQMQLYENGARPGGILSTETQIASEDADRLRDEWTQDFTGENAGQVAILGYGLKYQPLAIEPEKMEMIASRGFAVEEIARIFQVPPPLLGDYRHNTFTNSQSAARWFAQHCLGPWVRKFEAALERTLLSERERRSMQIEFDMSSLLRGDDDARWNTHKIAVENEILTTDEIREIEGWNPRGGRDE